MPLSDTGLGKEGEICLGRKQLRRASYGWNTLQDQFPKALSSIVDDAEGWRRMTPTLFDLLSQSIHRNVPLPESLFDARFGFSPSTAGRASRLARRNPRLCVLLNAMSWTLCLSPALASGALSWVEANNEALKNLLDNVPQPAGTGVAMRLWDVARQEGERRIAPILASLGCPDAFSVVTHGGSEYLTAWLRLLARMTQKTVPSSWSWPEKPKAEWAAAVLQFFVGLLDEPPQFRRQALDLFGWAFPHHLLVRWREWWASVGRSLAWPRRLIAKAAAESWRKRSLLASQARACALRISPSAAPPEITHGGPYGGCAKGLLRAIRRLAHADFQAARTALLPVLRSVEAEVFGVLPRTHVLLQVANWLCSEPAKRVAEVLRALRLSGIPSDEVHRVISADGFDDLLCTDVNPARACRAVACWLRELTETSQYSQLHWPIAISRAVGEPARMDAFLHQLADRTLAKASIPSDVIRCAAQIAPHEGVLIALVRSLQRASWKEPRICSDATLIAEELARSGWGHLASEAILEGDASAVLSLGMRVRLLRLLGSQLGPRPLVALKPPRWSLRYPEKLRSSIAVLAAVSPDAERIAAGLLSDCFPAESALAEELEAIESRLAADPANARLARRRDNLLRRLERPCELSTVRLEHLDAKLRRAIRRAVFDAWHADIQARIEGKGSELLGVAAFPAWLHEDRHQQTLVALLELHGWARGWARELGLRLLRLRCGPLPWNLVDEPANQAFIDQLRGLGVNPDPWVQPAGPSLRTGKNGRQVWLDFEQDPLEILQMGAHFNTCLSPGSFNFFSAVANGADINKHVVYARDASGQVVGRCLIAMADTGGLLAFHAYCHDPGLGFDQMMAHLVGELATQMSTAVVSRGTVPALVARDWYDDGPTDLCSRFPCLDEGSPLRNSLPEVELSQVVPLTEAALAPLPLNALTLPLLIALPEFDTRPELVIPLLPRIAQSGILHVDSALRAAELAHRAGASLEARRLIRAKVAPRMSFRSWGRWYLDDRAIQAVAGIDPSTALRLLRSTRARGIRRDDQETDPGRRRLLAQAHAALGRVAKAKKLMPAEEPNRQ